MNDELAKRDIAKAARMRLLGEDKIYKWEYDSCLARIKIRERIALRRAERHRSSSTKS